jgi:hypothetical protein
MSLIFSKHSKAIYDATATYQKLISDLEADISILAMAPKLDRRELALLTRLKSEYRDVLYKFENLGEACLAIEAEE